MRNPFAFRPAQLLALALLSVTALPGAFASDHADPMSLNVLQVQEDQEANITDLHAFIVDREGKLVTQGDPSVTGDQLILSLCVRRALRPDQIRALQLEGYKFRVHVDFSPPVEIFDETKTRDGGDYGQLLAKENKQIAEKTTLLEEARARVAKDPSDANKTLVKTAEQELRAPVVRRGNLIAAHDADRSMQALYGGVITRPDAIAETAVLEFELDLVADGEQSQAKLVNYQVQGIAGARNVVTREKKVGDKVVIQENPFQPGQINIEAGVFDDPFIFPRFFRRNVVGIVTSIPLANLVRPPGSGPIVLWATTHSKDGKPIDHQGRSLRTQLPRFGYLNDKHPADHVNAITRVHDRPTLMEDITATFIAPLIAHRHYDSVPDVIVYDLRKPARFPNGRALTDDVGAILAEAGETLLAELSYAESKQFPRATQNDKPFSPTFPYLAPRWTSSEVAAHAPPGTTMGDFAVPRAPDSAAIAALNFKDSSWRTLWAVEVVAIAILTLLLIFTVRSNGVRIGLVLLALISFCLLQYIYAANLPGTDPQAMQQPSQKLCRLLLGGGVIGLLTVGFFLALGWRWGTKNRPAEPMPPGTQDVSGDDRPSATDTYVEVHKAVLSDSYYGKTWDGPERSPLPLYKQTTGALLRGLLPFGKPFGFLQAARRTVRSSADLRWGSDEKGFRRLLHPMGICLAGKWEIDAAPPGTAYSGYFAPGASGRIIARYSTGGSNPFAGGYRSLSLVGKIYPPEDSGDYPPGAPANFFTQEDLGGNRTNSIREGLMTNSPPVSPWNKGKDLFQLFFIGLILTIADKRNSERQLYEIAELGKPAGHPTSCPRFMRLSVADETRPLGREGTDFREEILDIMYDRGNPQSQHPLIFNIDVSDAGKKHGAGIEWLTGQDWTRIGRITFTEAAASYNGDFVIHFRHPVWREDRNDPTTVARSELRASS